MAWVFNYLTEQFMLIQDQPFSLIYWYYIQEKKKLHSLFWQSAFQHNASCVVPQNHVPEMFYICFLPTGFYICSRWKDAVWFPLWL